MEQLLAILKAGSGVNLGAEQWRAMQAVSRHDLMKLAPETVVLLEAPPSANEVPDIEASVPQLGFTDLDLANSKLTAPRGLRILPGKRLIEWSL